MHEGYVPVAPGALWVALDLAHGELPVRSRPQEPMETARPLFGYRTRTGSVGPQDTCPEQARPHAGTGGCPSGTSICSIIGSAAPSTRVGTIFLRTSTRCRSERSSREHRMMTAGQRHTSRPGPMHEEGTSRSGALGRQPRAASRRGKRTSHGGMTWPAQGDACSWWWRWVPSCSPWPSPSGGRPSPLAPSSPEPSRGRGKQAARRRVEGHHGRFCGGGGVRQVSDRTLRGAKRAAPRHGC